MQDKASFQRNKSRGLKNELSQAQINQRIKNINLTKRLISYERYITAVPKEERRKDMKNDWHPETPRINRNLSLSQWNKEMKKWRKQVHAWGNLSEEVHKYICNLPALEKYSYLSKLKLPELSQVEIANLKKKNEEIANRTLRDVVRAGDDLDEGDNGGGDVGDNGGGDVGDNGGGDVGDYGDGDCDAGRHARPPGRILDKPLFFLPHNFSGTILNNKFVVIKRDALEDSLQSLKKNYEGKYRPLYERYCALYLTPIGGDSNQEEQSQTSDVAVFAKGAKDVSADDVMKTYLEKQKGQASQYLRRVDVKSPTRSSCPGDKMKKRF
ncbi:histone RNA hairpin-binding protein, putative [Plasmodium vivax]|uniref:Histone RNA hairpin-binding protein, putative n=1 Tax=Plasmodium vivax TaxID=5855 RepID=A0A1G4GYQ5_PLAVI|nr:histone RNA hairpin-binding protein, putative [Plasmodium vivax]